MYPRSGGSPRPQEKLADMLIAGCQRHEFTHDAYREGVAPSRRRYLAPEACENIAGAAGWLAALDSYLVT